MDNRHDLKHVII